MLSRNQRVSDKQKTMEMRQTCEGVVNKSADMEVVVVEAGSVTVPEGAGSAGIASHESESTDPKKYTSLSAGSSRTLGRSQLRRENIGTSKKLASPK